MAHAATEAGGRIDIDQLPDAHEVSARARGENFSVASVLLGRRNRDHLLAIYDYARLVDQIGDAAAGDRSALLDLIETDILRLFTSGGQPEHPVLRQLRPVVSELDLTPTPFLRLIEANRRDQRVVTYATFEELLGYCELSANPVGELVLAVFGVATPERIALSDRVCSALQLAEHWQDVAEDCAAGRIYLPAEDLDRFGVRASDLEGTETGPALRSLIAFEVQRARALLDEGAALVGTLHGRARLAVAGYVAGGRAALEAIDAAGHDVLAGAPRAGKARRLGLTLTTYRRGR